MAVHRGAAGPADGGGEVGEDAVDHARGAEQPGHRCVPGCRSVESSPISTPTAGSPPTATARGCAASPWAGNARMAWARYGRDRPGITGAAGSIAGQICSPRDVRSRRPAGPQVDADRTDPAVLADAAARDHRTPAQRNHDTLKTLPPSGVITERLGSHRGLAVATILTMSADDLEYAAGRQPPQPVAPAPVRDALSLAEPSPPWPAVFDHAGLPLHLGRMKRWPHPPNGWR